MDPQEHLGIKELWEIVWIAAYLKSVLPIWISSGTIRKRVRPGRDRWALPAPKLYEDFYVVRNIPEPSSRVRPDIKVDMETKRIQIDIGSLMDGSYSFGLGSAILYTATEGVLLYWVEKEPYVI